MKTKFENRKNFGKPNGKKTNMTAEEKFCRRITRKDFHPLKVPEEPAS